MNYISRKNYVTLRVKAGLRVEGHKVQSWLRHKESCPSQWCHCCASMCSDLHISMHPKRLWDCQTSSLRPQWVGRDCAWLSKPRRVFVILILDLVTYMGFKQMC